MMLKDLSAMIQVVQEALIQSKYWIQETYTGLPLLHALAYGLFISQAMGRPHGNT